MPSEEEWRELKGLNRNYRVSNHGRVIGPQNKILKPTLLQIGYYSVAISKGGDGVVRKYVHRLVAEAFIGPVPKGLVVNHKNGNPLDNRLVNLEIVTRSQNASHWAGKNRSSSAGRKHSGFCGRGHQLEPNKTHCKICRKLLKTGEIFPPKDTEWQKSIVKGYLVSADGRLWSNKIHRLLKPGTNVPGYKYFNLRINGETKPYALQRLVAQAFLREIGEGEVVDHINGDKSDNRIENLRIFSRKKNIMAVREKMRSDGRHGFKLNERSAGEIKWLLSNTDLTQGEIAKKYNISSNHVCTINTGRQWQHVEPVKP